MWLLRFTRRLGPFTLARGIQKRNNMRRVMLDLWFRNIQQQQQQQKQQQKQEKAIATIFLIPVVCSVVLSKGIKPFR